MLNHHRMHLSDIQFGYINGLGNKPGVRLWRALKQELLERILSKLLIRQ